MRRTLKELAQEVLAVQNASNPIGIANSYGQAMKHLRDALVEAKLPSGSNDVARHPISLLWLCKLTDMAGYSNDKIVEANTTCEQLAQS